MAPASPAIVFALNEQRRRVDPLEIPAKRHQDLAQVAAGLGVPAIAPQQIDQLLPRQALAEMESKIGQQGLALLSRDLDGLPGRPASFEGPQQLKS